MALERDLSPEEVRVLGCLVEKAATTPDNYPLSSNALVAACNQKTSRDPVVAFDERTVDAAMLSLRERGLARSVRGAGSRVVKHRHVLDEALGLSGADLAVVSVLALRGPQTPGELRTRGERQHAFADVDEVERTLEDLAQRVPPLVRDVGRGPGQKETRFAHLLSADADAESGDGATRGGGAVSGEGAAGFGGSSPAGPSAGGGDGATRGGGARDSGGSFGAEGAADVGRSAGGGDDTELAELRAEVAALRESLDEIRRELGMGPAAP